MTNSTETYRKEHTSLYKWDADEKSYRHVYLCGAGVRTKAQAIAAYEDELYYSRNPDEFRL